MKLLIIDQSDYTTEEVFDKCQEELSEVDSELTFNDDIDRQLSEIWDFIQSGYSLLRKVSGGRMDLLEESNIHHIEKLRSRGHNILGEVELHETKIY